MPRKTAKPRKRLKPEDIRFPEVADELPDFVGGKRNTSAPAESRPSPRRVVAEIDDTYDEDVFVPESPPLIPEPPAFTTANEQQLHDILREIAGRKREALRLYKPYPNQEAFHRSRARKVLAVGGNRGGKTLVTAVEVGRALAGVDPYRKYPDRPLRAIFVGKDLIHCSKVMYRKLFKPGAFKILKDEDSGLWRAYDPATDGHREQECADVGPIIPPRLVRSISWEDKREEIAKTARLTNDAEATFFSGEGEPPQGWDVDLIWLDEEIGHPKWISEMIPRLVDRGGRLFWSFTPQIGSPAAYDLMNQADLMVLDEDAPVQKFFFNIDTNVYISEERREAFKQDLAHDEEEYRVRVLGQSALEGQRVYGEFAPNGVHKCPTFVIPDDWTRYAYIDPGRQVAAALFFAVPPKHHEYARHEAICYDEIYHKKANAQTFAQKVKQHVGEHWIQDWVIDGHAARVHEIGSGVDVETQYREAFLAAGLEPNGFRHFIWGADDLDGGILAVKGKLQVVDGFARFLFMTENLRWLKWEAERYANKKLSRVNIITDKPEKRHDHLMDCLRYASQHPMRYVPPPRSKKSGKSWVHKYLDARRKKESAASRTGGSVGVF